MVNRMIEECKNNHRQDEHNCRSFFLITFYRFVIVVETNEIREKSRNDNVNHTNIDRQ